MEADKTYRQFMVGLSANLSNLLLGISLGWASAMTPKLTADSPNNPMGRPLTADEMSWVEATVFVGGIFGPLAAGIVANKFGRKMTLLGAGLFSIIALLLVAYAEDVQQIQAARLIQGCGQGFGVTVLTMYVGEIASDRCRGALGSLTALFTILGFLFVHCIGSLVTYMQTQWICLIIPCIFIVSFSFMPESPYFYVSKGELDLALKSLCFLRGKPIGSVVEELKLVEATVGTARVGKKSSKLKVITKRGNVLAMVICLGLLIVQQLCGIHAIHFYREAVLEQSANPRVTTIVVCLVQVAVSCTIPLVVDRLGRRPLLLLSAVGMSLSSIIFGTYCTLSAGTDKGLYWTPMTTLILYLVSFTLGFGATPWVILGEMFAPNVKSCAISIASASSWLTAFLVIRYSGPMVGESCWSFWIIGVVAAVAMAFTLAVVVETKGLSLKEIQTRLNRESIRSITDNGDRDYS